MRDMSCLTIMNLEVEEEQFRLSFFHVFVKCTEVFVLHRELGYLKLKMVMCRTV